LSNSFPGPAVASPTPSRAEANAVPRAKTVATRLSSEELAEVEAAAKRGGKSLAEWLRETALREARQRPADPVELLLSEVAATRYMLLNLFHAMALANGEGHYLSPESVLKVRDTANARKFSTARKMLEDFLAQDPPEDTTK
jgi:uncharacterized protein (DUF1778 family)